MTSPWCVAPRIARLFGIGVLAAFSPLAWTQVAPADAPPAGSAFQDHYIAGGTLTPDVSSGDSLSADTSGLARSIRIDGVASYLSQQGPNSPPPIHEDGLIVNAQWDTSAYGAWSADGALRTGNSVTGFSDYGTGSFALHQRGMPFDDGWLADNALGDINAPLIDLARLQPRFLLTQSPLAGFDTEWHGPEGLEFLAGGGEPGIYDGIKVPAFNTLGGTTGTLGAEWAASSQWTLGGQLATARNTDLYYQPINSGLGTASDERISSTTGFLTAAWQSGANHAQFNFLDGTLDGSGNASGTWVDAGHTSGAITQSAGLFRIDPNLAWANQLITSDVQGGYYRVDFQSRRWLADFDVDEVSSVSGVVGNTTFITGDTRYQLNRDTGIGGVINLRRGDLDNAWSAEGYLDRANSLGSARLQLDYATDPQTQDATVTAQQTWTLPAGERLATTLAADHIRSSAFENFPQEATIARLALYGGGELTSRLSLSGTVQLAATVQGHAAPSQSADVSLNYQLSRWWSLAADYYENRVGSWTQLVITSPLAPPTAQPVSGIGARGVFLTLRYQEARGAHFAPLGGAAGAGSGSLSGVVYLDANENGRFDAGETGAANVMVVLDGRYAVRTDNNGRYSFPAVAAGHHVLTVSSDNLPLPWVLTNSGRTELQVYTRESTTVDIGALRMK
jgi:hypothetical protein